MLGVTITLILGNNGIINNALKSKNNTRAAQINEKIKLFKLDNEIAKYSDSDSLSKEEFINELVKEGLLTKDEEDLLKTQNIIQIGDNNIDFSFLNESYIGKIVNYKNTIFLIIEENNEMLNAVAIEFPIENNYMLSGTYKIINGNKISVDPESDGATFDESGEEFIERVKNELDRACQEKYGRTGDNPISAFNIYGRGFLVYDDMYYTQLSDLINYYKECDKILNALKNSFNISDKKYEQALEDFYTNRSTSWYVYAEIFEMMNVFNRLSLEGLNEDDYNQINTVQQLSRSGTNIESLGEIKEAINIVRQIGDKDKYIVDFIEKNIVIWYILKTENINFWIASQGGDEYWVNSNSSILDDPCGVYLANNEHEYADKHECPICPIISFNSNLLKENSNGFYLK